MDLPLRGSPDGSRISLDAHRVRVVPALAAEGGPLVGMSLLRGGDVWIQAIEDGEVVIRPLPSA